MIINSKSTLKTVKEYLFLYRIVFYKRSFQIFTLIILSIITIQKVQSIKFIYERFISKYWNKSINSFYYFLNDKNHSIEDMMRITTKIGISQIPSEIKEKATIYLSIDEYKFCSPQEIKHVICEAIMEELFFSNLFKLDQIKKNLTRIPYLRQFKDVEDLAS